MSDEIKVESPDVAVEVKEPEVLKRYVKPHTKVAREVTEADLPRVIEEGIVMYELCRTKVGMYPAGFAVAHPQIDDKDPLRFYVTYDGDIVINPVIVRHTKTTVSDLEGCLSFPNFMPIQVPRYHKCEMEYVEVTEEDPDHFTPVRHVKLSGREARIAQHECQHFDGSYIYSLEETK